MLSFIGFFQNPHYSYNQEHLTPSTSICIFPCFFMIYQSCQKNNCHDNPQPSYNCNFFNIPNKKWIPLTQKFDIDCELRMLFVLRKGYGHIPWPPVSTCVASLSHWPCLGARLQALSIIVRRSEKHITVQTKLLSMMDSNKCRYIVASCDQNVPSSILGVPWDFSCSGKLLYSAQG